MSDKKRRDITLGEMQDECLKHNMCEGCPHAEWCGANSADGWDLTDPPRFNAAQMAFWRGWYGIGATRAWRSDANNSRQCVHVHDAEDKYLGYLQIEYDALPIRCGETLDLAELLGKDGESK